MARRMPQQRVASSRGALRADVAEPLGTFMCRVGLLLYKHDWVDAALGELNRIEGYAVGSDADMAFVVRDQVISSLQSEKVKAQVFVTVAATAAVRLPRSCAPDDDASSHVEEELDLEDDDPIDPLLGEDSTPKQRRFLLNPAYWSMHHKHTDLDWQQSTVTIPSKYLLDPQNIDVEISSRYIIGENIKNVVLFISNPHAALRSFFKYDKLPGDDWLERYKIYKERARFESLAVMWRYLAVGEFTADNAPSAVELSRRAQEYLRGQGLARFEEKGRRDAGLEEMARRILEQFTDRNLSTSVLVSATPGKRGRD